jgi:hypothetical protein
MPSTGPTTIAGPPSVIVQASLESEAFRIAALTPAGAVAGTKRGRAALRPIPQRRFGRYPAGND